jgi:hypothetical protein
LVEYKTTKHIYNSEDRELFTLLENTILGNKGKGTIDISRTIKESHNYFDFWDVKAWKKDAKGHINEIKQQKLFGAEGFLEKIKAISPLLDKIKHSKSFDKVVDFTLEDLFDSEKKGILTGFTAPEDAWTTRLTSSGKDEKTGQEGWKGKIEELMDEKDLTYKEARQIIIDDAPPKPDTKTGTKFESDYSLGESYSAPIGELFREGVDWKEEALSPEEKEEYEKVKEEGGEALEEFADKHAGELIHRILGGDVVAAFERDAKKESKQQPLANKLKLKIEKKATKSVYELDAKIKIDLPRNFEDEKREYLERDYTNVSFTRETSRNKLLEYPPTQDRREVDSDIQDTNESIVVAFEDTIEEGKFLHRKFSEKVLEEIKELFQSEIILGQIENFHRHPLEVLDFEIHIKFSHVEILAYEGAKEILLQRMIDIKNERILNDKDWIKENKNLIKQIKATITDIEENPQDKHTKASYTNLKTMLRKVPLEIGNFPTSDMTDLTELKDKAIKIPYLMTIYYNKRGTFSVVPHRYVSTREESGSRQYQYQQDLDREIGKLIRNINGLENELE